MPDIDLGGEGRRPDDGRGRTAAGAEVDRASPETDGAPGRGGMAAWFEGRTGLGSLVRVTFNPPVPRLARWRYAAGAALVTCLAVEFFTGILLMFSYSPSAATAWGSTFHIDQVQSFGWFLRGMHNFAAHAMIIVTAAHLATVVIAGVYRAPRELNWLLGLAMFGLLVAFTLSGNALVWDQDGYWAWHVETGIAGGTPWIGPTLQRVILGGTELGNATVSRLYAFHISILPILVLALLAGHVGLSRRHALSVRRETTVEPAWPQQIFYNMLASAVLVGIVALLVVLNGGVSLEAPADPASSYPARPAWFFFWLFELRKGFPGPREYIATMVIPGVLATVLLLLPFFDRVLPRRLGHALACLFVAGLFLFAAVLTGKSVVADWRDADFQEATAEADRARVRALELARDQGVPPEGASALLGRDPLWHGRAVLRDKCLGCHTYDGITEGEEPPSAPELRGFGSRAWLRGLLESPQSAAYFGKVPACDGMAEWKKSSKLKKEELEAVTDLVASFATIPADLTPLEWLNLPEVAEHPGMEPFQKDCGTCHVVQDLTEGGTRDAPQLFAYGSPQWIRRMVLKPGAPDMYGYLDPKDQMPSFSGQLTENDVQCIIRYLRDDYPGAPGQPPKDTPKAASKGPAPAPGK